MNWWADTASNYGSWLLLGAIVFSALVGAAIAIVAVATQRSTARKREALHIMLETESAPYYQSIRDEFLAIRDSKKGFSTIAKVVAGDKKRNKKTNKQISSVSNFLNHYETICVGIKKGIIDEKICNSWMRSTLIRHWEDATPFIEAARAGNPRTYAFFKAIAEKWMAEDERDKRRAQRKALR